MRRIILLVALFFIALPAFAQNEDLVVTVTPNNPAALAPVTVSVESFATDLGQAKISWLLNGKAVASAAGKTSLNFTTGNYGNTDTVTIAVLTKEGTALRKTVTIKPAEIDLLWQTDTFTPPFYRGKALYSNQSAVTVVAIPHMLGRNGNPIPVANLVFTWKEDHVVKGSLSGYGKNSYTFTGNPLFKPTLIEVEITAPVENIKSNATMSLAPRNPQVLVYVNDPLYGLLLNNAITASYPLDVSEVRLAAVPYFFSSDSAGTKNLNYNWTINNSDGATNQKDIVLRHEGDSSGTSIISLQVDNATNFLQKASLDFSIGFGEKKSQKTLSF